MKPGQRAPSDRPLIAAEAVAGVREGDVIAGKYAVEKVLGVGGMGAVVAARHLQLDTRVAIKFLLPEMLAHREAMSRFEREARAAVRITSEHVARVLDVGTLETGAPYMVMEFLEGKDLSAWLRQSGPLRIDQAVEFALQACVGVAEAHALGIVHRDLKPANLFCTPRTDGKIGIKVLDFGISKAADAGGSVTRTTTIMGSPHYMSPEQMRASKDVDARTDIWAMGIVLYELLAGRPPFEGESLTDIALKVAGEAPPPLRVARPDVPVRLEAAILRCLEKDRNLRFRNVGRLAASLVEFAPAHARASAERIDGIVQTSGLSGNSPSIPSTLMASVSPTGATTSPTGTGILRRKSLWTIALWVALPCALALTVALSARRAFSPSKAPLVVDSPTRPVLSTPASPVETLPPIQEVVPPPLASPIPATTTIARAMPALRHTVPSVSSAHAAAAAPAPSPSTPPASPPPKRNPLDITLQ